MPEAGKSLFIMVGELSADKHTSKLLRKLKELAPDLKAWGGGGPAMLAEGFEQVYDCEHLTGVGVVELVKMLPVLTETRKNAVLEIEKRKPDAVLLVDSSGLNLGIAGDLRKKFPNIPILYFISPQVWATRPWRIKKIARTISKMLVIFPFEEGLYRAHGVEARFVGSPVMTNVPLREDLKTREEFCAAIGVDPKKFVVGIFPGSRKAEIDTLVPLAADAMKTITDTRSDIEFVVSQASESLAERISARIARLKLPDKVRQRLHFVQSDSNYDLMANSDLIWAKSGTTSLEVTLFGTPMLIFYRGFWISYFLFLIAKHVKRVGWPNLLAGKYLVPELIQLDCRAELLVRYTCDLLDVPELRKDIRSQLLTLRRQLGQGDYVTNCAEEILKAVGERRQIPEPSQANV